MPYDDITQSWWLRTLIEDPPILSRASNDSVDSRQSSKKVLRIKKGEPRRAGSFNVESPFATPKSYKVRINWFDWSKVFLFVFVAPDVLIAIIWTIQSFMTLCFVISHAYFPSCSCRSHHLLWWNFPAASLDFKRLMKGHIRHSFKQIRSWLCGFEMCDFDLEFRAEERRCDVSVAFRAGSLLERCAGALWNWSTTIRMVGVRCWLLILHCFALADIMRKRVLHLRLLSESIDTFHARWAWIWKRVHACAGLMP